MIETQIEEKAELNVATKPRASRRRSLSLPLGALLITAGIIFCAGTLEWTIFPDGTIPPGSRRALALLVIRGLLVGFGALLLWKRPYVTVVHLTACLLMGGFAALCGSVAAQFVIKPHRIVCGWRAFAPPAEQNQFGFRGKPIAYSPQDYVVLLLGDSQVEAMALPFGSMPEQLLEDQLKATGKNARVFSLGTGGYGQDQELLALQEYLKAYRADLVILWQTPDNDIWNNLFNTHMINRNPKPTFWLESAELQGPSEGLGQSLGDSPVVVAALWQRVIGLPYRDKAWERRLPQPYAPLNHFDGPVNSQWQERWKANLGRMRDENLATEKSHLAMLLTPRSKRMQYGLDLTRALTRRIQEVVAARNGKLVLLQVDNHPFVSEADQIYTLNGKYYRVSKSQFDANCRYIQQGFETEIIPVTIPDWRVGPEDGHLNLKANEQVMRDLARDLVRRMSEKTS